MRAYKFTFYSLFLITSCQSPSSQPVGDSNNQRIQAISDDKKMVLIKGGTYTPFFSLDSINEVHISSFYMDECTVTNSEYLRFVEANPQWSRSKVLKLYADSNYLKNWVSDVEPPLGISPDAPVTNVSWYAAKAYAESVGKRLPTVDEWEYVGVADDVVPNASNDPTFTDKIIDSYRTGERYKIPVKTKTPNFYGIYDMYGSVWEWTSDFNSIMMTGESRNNNQKDENLFCAGAALSSTDLKNYAAFIRFAMRGSLKADYCIHNLGFRCVKDYH